MPAEQLITMEMDARIDLASGIIELDINGWNEDKDKDISNWKNTFHIAEAMEPDSPVKLGESIHFGISEILRLEIDVLSVAEASARGDAYFIMSIPDRKNDSLFCPLCGFTGPFSAIACISVQLDSNRDVIIPLNQELTLDTDDETDTCCEACAFRGSRYHFDPAYWAMLKKE